MPRRLLRNKNIKFKIKKISLNSLYFQYYSKTFIHKYFPGTEKNMLRVDNSPHYRFLKLYQKIGNEILQCYNQTEYIQLMKDWGRDDKHNKWKVNRFLSTYNSIKKRGMTGCISVVSSPVEKKFFTDGYEIYHGHHRSAICSVLGIKHILCKVLII